jgi:hypothetical protein
MPDRLHAPPAPRASRPAVQPSQELDVGDQRRVIRPECLEQRHGFFPGAGDCRLEAAISQYFLQETLNVLVILDD